MRVFRRIGVQLSVRLGSRLPDSVVDHFRDPGRFSFEAAFAQRAQRYRRSVRIVIMLMLSFGLGLLAAVKLPVSGPARLWIAGVAAALLPIALVLHFVNRRLRCPACGKKLTPAKGSYCPQCGSHEFRARSNYCPGCGGRIEEESGDDERSYRVRGCTHCGVFLDEQGV